MLGTRMDSRIEGVRGWGVPSESIFEVSQPKANLLVPCWSPEVNLSQMFSLPGLEGKK